MEQLFHLFNVIYFTASFKVLPALNAGTLVAGISMVSPVLKSVPLRGARSRTSKLPKPTNFTASPLDKKSATAPNTASTAYADCFFVHSNCAATVATSSFLCTAIVIIFLLFYYFLFRAI